MSNVKLTSVFIVDDNRDAIKVLQLKLENNYAVEVVGTAVDAENAAEGIVKTEPDLIFLDIELPTMSGLEFWEKIRNELKPETKVVFYTGHEKYMLEAIRKQAFDYLLKPPTDQDLAQLMTRYYENRLNSLPPHIDSGDRLPLILVLDVINQHVTLKLEDIGFFRYNQERKMWEVICNNKTTYTLRHRTTADIIMNYSPDFVQIHKRYIVNINQISMIKGPICIMKSPLNEMEMLQISKNYRASFMEKFYSL